MSSTVPALTYRSKIGKKLTSSQVDENFRKLSDFSNGLSALMGVALNPDGTIKDPNTFFAASTSSTDDYDATVSSSIVAMATLIGRVFVLLPSVNSSGDATLNVNGLGATMIKRQNGLSLNDGDMAANYPAVLVYNGTYFELVNPLYDDGRYNFGIDVGTANAILLTKDSGRITIPTELKQGYEVTFILLNSNTGASTIQIGTLQAVPLKVQGTDLQVGELKSGGAYRACYNGGVFELVSFNRKKEFESSSYTFGLTGTDLNYGTILTVPHGLGKIPKNVKCVIVCVEDPPDALGLSMVKGDEIDVLSCCRDHQTPCFPVSANLENVFVHSANSYHNIYLPLVSDWGRSIYSYWSYFRIKVYAS